MKIDFDAKLKNLNGDEIKRGHKAEDGSLEMHEWPAGQIAAEALMTPQPQGKVQTTSQVTARYALALRLHQCGQIEITAQEAVMIQESAVHAFAHSPMIAAQIIALTEGKGLNV